jgi:membrane-associated protein
VYHYVQSIVKARRLRAQPTTATGSHLLDPETFKTNHAGRHEN